MTRRIDSLSLVLASAAFVLAAGCSGAPVPGQESTTDEVGVATEAASGGVNEVRAIDDCDPATFGALCNQTFNGGTTLASFQAELAKKMSVGRWKYSSAVNTKAGTPVSVVSRGGENHTFTVVAKFGGGKVPGLNTASGNPIPAPSASRPRVQRTSLSRQAARNRYPPARAALCRPEITSCNVVFTRGCAPKSK